MCDQPSSSNRVNKRTENFHFGYFCLCSRHYPSTCGLFPSFPVYFWSACAYCFPSKYYCFIHCHAFVVIALLYCCCLFANIVCVGVCVCVSSNVCICIFSWSVAGFRVRNALHTFMRWHAVMVCCTILIKCTDFYFVCTCFPFILLCFLPDKYSTLTMVSQEHINMFTGCLQTILLLLSGSVAPFYALWTFFLGDCVVWQAFYPRVMKWLDFINFMPAQSGLSWGEWVIMGVRDNF